MGGSKAWPAGSTARQREDILAVLGVVKLATADQLWRLTRPDAASNKAARNACNDLEGAGLLVSDGSTQAAGQLPPARRAAATTPQPGGRREGAKKIWRLTPAGLDAAAAVLADGRPMGSTARGAGASGAPHAIAVTETIAAFLQPSGARPGTGQITDWATEVVLPLTGTTGRTAQRGNPRADALLHAPGEEIPLLIVEVDRGGMGRPRLAAKFDAYRHFFRRQAKDDRGRTQPFWRTLFTDHGGEGHPPVAVVFADRPEAELERRMKRMREDTTEFWAGRRYRSVDGFDQDDPYTDYSDAIPVLATTLKQLREHGPHGRIWWRFGHRRGETLAQALADPDGERAWLRRDYERDERERQQRLAEEAERERRRPACTGCGIKFSDGRWRRVEEQDWGTPAHPELCDACATTAREREEQQARQAAAERAAAEAAAAQQATRRGLFRRRT